MKKNSFTFVAAIITLALTGGAVSATGCGGVSASSLCSDICACERCTSNDLQACEDSGDKAAQAADAAGCSSEFDDAVACASEHVSCKSTRAAFEGCEAEEAALTKCSSTLSVFDKNPCELAAARITVKINSCPNPPKDPTTSSSSGGTPECTDAAGTLALCQAAALDLATCDCLGLGNTNNCPPEESKAFIDALSLCK